MNSQDIPKPATPLPWTLKETYQGALSDRWKGFPFKLSGEAFDVALFFGDGTDNAGTTKANAEYLLAASNSYPDALHEKEAALALADALRARYRQLRDACEVLCDQWERGEAAGTQYSPELGVSMAACAQDLDAALKASPDKERDQLRERCGKLEAALELCAQMLDRKNYAETEGLWDARQAIRAALNAQPDGGSK